MAVLVKSSPLKSTIHQLTRRDRLRWLSSSIRLHHRVATHAQRHLSAVSIANGQHISLLVPKVRFKFLSFNYHARRQVIEHGPATSNGLDDHPASSSMDDQWFQWTERECSLDVQMRRTRRIPRSAVLARSHLRSRDGSTVDLRVEFKQSGTRRSRRIHCIIRST